jgi:hypothetical protein
MGFFDLISAWKEYGVFEFFLPFLLMFTIFYALLRKSKIFGEPNQVGNVNTIVALIAALFVMIYTPAGISLTMFFSNFFTQTMVVLTTILSFTLIVYMMPIGDPAAALSNMKYLIPVAGLIMLFVFIAAGGLKIFGIELGSPGRPGTIILPTIGMSSEDLAFIVMLLGFLAVVLYLNNGGEGKVKGKRVIGYKSVPIHEGE